MQQTPGRALIEPRIGRTAQRVRPVSKMPSAITPVWCDGAQHLVYRDDNPDADDTLNHFRYGEDRYLDGLCNPVDQRMYRTGISHYDLKAVQHEAQDKRNGIFIEVTLERDTRAAGASARTECTIEFTTGELRCLIAHLQRLVDVVDFDLPVGTR